MEVAALAAAPAVAIAREVREQRVSPPEIVRAHLERIDALEPGIGAFTAVRRDEALAEAQALGERDLSALPLAGVPVAVKDNFDVAGLPTRHGSVATPDTPAESDDEAVRRLREAGCVVIGKTHMPELAIWPFTEGAAFAPTRNPWDPSRTPGGSSGGGAAAVAAGMAALGLGSDGGGSLRIPGACCGVVGLKPAPGLVPLSRGAPEHWHGLTAAGPLARTAADAGLALDVLAGTSAYSEARPPEGPLRIAYWVRHPTLGARTAPSVRAAFEEAVGTLRRAGHELVEARPPYPPDLSLRFSSRWLAGIAQDAADLDDNALEPRTRKMARTGKWAARRVKPATDDPFAARARSWLAEYDALITPTLARPAVPVGEWEGMGWVRTMLSVGNWLYTPPWNLAAVPAASVPFGDDGGIPLGLQIVARVGGEATILALAAEVERLRPWPQVAPVAAEGELDARS